MDELARRVEGAAQDDWMVVETHPNRETLALENLGRQLYRTYCPKVSKRVRHARRAYDVARPMFPGYVFVEANRHAARWRPILSTLGVRGLVRAGDRPGLLRGDFVTALQAREIDGVICLPERNLAAGQRVAVQGGPMDGWIGTVLETRENQRHLILLELVRGTVKAHISERHLRVVS